MAVRLLLADSHPIVRHGLRCVLETEPAFEVVGEASDGLIALHMMEQLQPTVVLLDFIMPTLSGLEVVRRIKLGLLATSCVMFTMHNNESYIREAFRQGAAGYLLKHEETHEILRAIHTVVAGDRYLSAGGGSMTLASLASDTKELHTDDAYDTLTARERTVLQMVAEGATNAAIALLLYVSARTIEIHRANAMRKLTLNNRTALIRYALRRGLLSAD